MLFDFYLRPIDRVAPWGQEGQPILHWFGLTDGWYWMHVGTEELFRYTDDILARWEHPTNHNEDLPYVDYYVVRLWEDLLAMLPHVLEPIPHSVRERLEIGVQTITWRDQMMDRLSRDTDDVLDSTYDLLDRATSWLDHRWLDVGYLQHGPRIWFWSDGQMIFVHWDNRAIQSEGMSVWTATEGTMMFPLQVFIDEVRAFDQRLIQVMNDRVAAVQRHWSRPDVQIDLPGLLQEQQDRGKWMERALVQARSKPVTAWDAILESIERLERGDFAR